MRRSVVYQPGDLFTIADDEYQVVGVAAGRLCAQNCGTAELMYFDQLDLLSPHRTVGDAVDIGFNPFDTAVSLLVVPEQERPRVSMWVNHLLELESGHHPDHPQPRPQYRTTLAKHKRVHAKAEELSSITWPDGRRHQVSVRTVERNAKKLRDEGPLGLLPSDSRLRRAGGNQDPEFIRILDSVLADFVSLTDVPMTTLCRRIRLAFVDEHPEWNFYDTDAVSYHSLPSESTIRRLIKLRGSHLFVEQEGACQDVCVRT